MSIELDHLTKKYNGVAVVNRVSLEIQDGEFYILLGGSGSGKSTILRIIAGLSMPDEGRILLHGKDVTGLPPQARNTGFVFQNYAVFRHMTVENNIGFGLTIRNVKTEKKAARVKELLEMVGLVGLEKRYPDQLSGGQLQRVAMARALAYEPSLLLLDEPFGALDVKIRQQLRESFKEIQRHLKITTILVTHDQEEAFELADRIGVIERGLLLENGSPEELYRKPSTEHVATFIGGGNVLVGREQDGQIQLGRVLLPIPPDAPGHPEGAPIRVLFRPEEVDLSERPFGDMPEDIYQLGKGEVVRTIFNGPVERLILNVDGIQGSRPLTPSLRYGQPFTQIEAVKTSNNLPAGPLEGRTFWVGVRRYHILDPSGMRLLVFGGEHKINLPALECGCLLASQTHGHIKVFSMVAGRDQEAERWKSIERVIAPFRDRIPQISLSLFQGSALGDMFGEIQDDFHDIFLIGPLGSNTIDHIMPGRILPVVLQEMGIPVMVVPRVPQEFRSILICTGAGEPGKSDIRFGGRIAHRIGIPVDILHVQRQGTNVTEKKRVKKNLDEAKRMLQALQVETQTRVRTGEVFEEIVRETEEKSYDLIVIGAPFTKTGTPEFHPTSLIGRLLEKLKIPVIIVPMEE